MKTEVENTRHSEFKETEIGRIPKEWEVSRLRDIVDNDQAIVAGPFGSNLKVSDYKPAGAPIIRLQNIERNTFVDKDTKYISGEKSEELRYHSYEPGDLVLAKLGDPIGKTCIVPSFIKQGIVVADVVRIRVAQRKASRKFVEYVLNSPFCSIQLRKETIGSTRPRVNITQVRNLKLPLPSLPEQRKIAEVLSTVDEAIQKVDQTIEKTQRLKKGLMQQLLTRGIGHSEFKETEIGRIPKEWEVIHIFDIADVKGGKRLPKGHKFANHRTSYPYIRVVDFRDMSVEAHKVRFLLPETQKSIERYTISANDIYISIAGTVGLCGMIPKTLDGANLTENAAKICNLRRMVKEFVAYVLNSYIGQRQIEAFVGKAQQPKLALFRIKKLKLPLPPLPEQRKIAEILGTVDERIRHLRGRKETLQRIKKGLMQDLLTGRKRVKV